MPLKNIFQNIYTLYPGFQDTDFIVGKDSFEDVQINGADADGSFWWFKNRKKGLIKRFVLEKTLRTEKACVVTLIRKPNGKFSPRFDFHIYDTTKRAFENFSKEKVDENLIKAKVSLDSCYESFLLLIDFICKVKDVEFIANAYGVVDQKKKEVIELIGDFDKVAVLDAVQKKFGTQISEGDISLLLNRKTRLEYFRRLLYEPTFFDSEKQVQGHARDEDIWQHFFEENQWIFGYGLQLVACEGLDDRKLEQTVVGNDLVDGSGKRIDALLKTKGSISKILFCEIKTHKSNLLIEPYDRPGVYVPAKELRGAVAQIQKTIHKVALKVEQSLRPKTASGDPTGEEILFVKPRGVVVIGVLDDFKKDHGINYEELSSFEIYRQQVNGIEIITYDELYERAKFIAETAEVK